MNRKTSQTQQIEPVTSNTITTKSEASDKITNADYTPLLEWSNLKYGLFMIAVIVIPPLIPGASVRLLIMGYMFVIVSIYFVAAIISAMKVIHPLKTPKRGKFKKNYH